METQDFSTAGLSKAEKAVVAQCKREAQQVFTSARVAYPVDSMQPDLKAHRYLVDCMTQRNPNK